MRLAGAGVIQHAPILGHDPIEQMRVREDTLQVIELAASHHHQLSPGRAQALQGTDGRRVDLSVVGKRPVVIAGEGEVPHGLVPDFPS